MANLRRDGLHKLTTRLARECGTIVVEDLNVAGKLRSRRLARRVADAGFGEIRRQVGPAGLLPGSCGQGESGEVAGAGSVEGVTVPVGG
ncbi:hypothetical protein [Micromonospora sp. CB01531]|uniref:hypothetical protein n=1 Tax=Micromonospora sp. CB01531 TaxID=1718947 RepID=UPI0023792962|nr:hypothetical protein [Micromonospora sp. CB01531]